MACDFTWSHWGAHAWILWVTPFGSLAVLPERTLTWPWRQGGFPSVPGVKPGNPWPDPRLERHFKRLSYGCLGVTLGRCLEQTRAPAAFGTRARPSNETRLSRPSELENHL